MASARAPTDRYLRDEDSSKRRGLLALTTGSGQVVYPIFQLTGSDVVDGLDEVLAALPENLVSRWTVAPWLATPRETPRTHWFSASATTPGGGRFDLSAPRGFCYLSDRFEGAWLEVFRDTGLVDRGDVARRCLLRARRSTPLDVADLACAGARAFGVTLDLVTGDDYALPRRWAASLQNTGHPGVTGSTRHDPAGEARTVVVFGSAGSRSAVRGWRTTTAALDDASLLDRLTAYGTGVLDRPRDVTVRRPPGLTPR